MINVNKRDCYFVCANVLYGARWETAQATPHTLRGLPVQTNLHTDRKNGLSILIRPPVQSPKTAQTYVLRTRSGETVQAGLPGKPERVRDALNVIETIARLTRSTGVRARCAPTRARV